ncbi:MAG TPA: alkaline phosphatase family protein [Kofleriaceae bacterium]|nr:alkaline phosphatase family protein [Kofleriaceae bacterium]
MTLRAPTGTASTRRVVAAALALVVLGAVGAVKAGLAGGDFMFDLEQAQPALARQPPVVPDPHTLRLSRRVFLVIIDGLRLDKSYDLPFLDSLRRGGVDTEAQSHYPTWSRPNYVSILTGVPPSASGVRTNHHSTPVALDSLMDRVNAAGLRAAAATDYDVLPRLFLRKRSPGAILPGEDDTDIDAMESPMSAAAVRAPDADLASPFHDARYAPWPGGFAEAGSALAAGDDELVVLLIGVVDAAGHAHGGASPEYREAAEIADRALARALGRVDLSQDTIVVTADHGHTDRGGHGGIEPEVLSVPLVIAGAGVKPGATSDDAQLIDIAPTVAALLGVPAPGHGLGRTLTELIALPDAARDARFAADQVRLTTTRAVVAAAEARADTDVLENRAQRIAIVAGGAVLAILLAVLLIRRRVLRLDLRVLLVSVPAFFVVYYALIGTLGQRFSPSLLPAQGHLAAAMAKYGLAAMVVQLATNLWALRSFRSLGERLAAANGVAWMGLMLAMIPAGLLWAYFPPPYVSLPGPVWLVLIPAVQVGVACAAVDVALTLLVEVIVFVARAWHREAPAIETID